MYSCVLCKNEKGVGPVIPFTNQKFDMCKNIIIYRKLKNLKYGDIELTAESRKKGGYHKDCFREFMVLRRVPTTNNVPSEAADVSADRSIRIEGFCQCCLATGVFLNMDTPRAFQDCLKTCREAIKDLFRLEIPTTEKTELICNECEEKLKDCYTFRYILRKIQMSLRNSFKENFNSCLTIDSSSKKATKSRNNSITIDTPKIEINAENTEFIDNRYQSVDVTVAEKDIKSELLSDESNINTDHHDLHSNDKYAYSNSGTGPLSSNDSFESSYHIKDQLVSMSVRENEIAIKDETSDNDDDDDVNMELDNLPLHKDVGISMNEQNCNINHRYEAIKDSVEDQLTTLEPLSAVSGDMEKIQQKKTLAPLKRSVHKKNKNLSQVHRSKITKCSLCHSTMNNDNIFDHMAEVHGLKVVARIHPCRECNAKFKSEELLLCHIKANHPFKCDVCNRYFTLKVDWIKHKKTVHGMDQLCIFCSDVFPIQDDLRQHQNVVHPEKLLSCNLCSYDTYYKILYTQHMTKHQRYGKGYQKKFSKMLTEDL